MKLTVAPASPPVCGSNFHPSWRLAGWLLAWLLLFDSGGVVAAEESALFHQRPVLKFIENRLSAGATLAVPPDWARGQRVATDLEVQEALEGALADFLAPPSTFVEKVPGLIAELARLRPAQAPPWIGVATDSIVTHALPTMERDLQNTVAAAVEAAPAQSGEIVRVAIAHLAALMDVREHVPAGQLDMETAGRFAGEVVLASMKAAKNAPNPKASLIQISEGAIQEAAAEGANYLMLAVVAASVKGSAGVIDLPDILDEGFLYYSKSKQRAGVVCAGALNGAGPAAGTAIKDAAALHLPVTFGAYTTVVCDAYLLAASAAVAGAEAAPQLARFLTVANADFVPAALIGSIAACPQQAVELLQTGLNRDLVLRGHATARDIVEAAIMVREAQAPELAAAAVGHADPMEGNPSSSIAEGAARGALHASIGAAVAAQIAAQIAAQGSDPGEIKAIVAGAVAGAVATNKTAALSAIGFSAVATSRLGSEVIDQVLLSSPPGTQFAGVMGVLAADPGHAPALLERALHCADLAQGEAEPVAAGGALVVAMQAHPASSYAIAIAKIAQSGPASDRVFVAMLLGAGLVNPRSVAAAAAAVAARTELPSEPIVHVAMQGEPSMRAEIERAVEAAEQIKNNPAEVFRYVRGRAAVDRSAVPAVVAGAVIAAPSLAMVIGHASALAAPAAAPQIVARLFAFDPLCQGGADAPVPGDHMAELTEAVVGGVVEANLDLASEEAAVVDAVSAAVRCLVALAQDSSAQPPKPQVVAAGLCAVVAAGVRPAPAHGLEIARAVGRALHELSFDGLPQAQLADAVVAGGRVDRAQIMDRIAAGSRDAALEVPAAAARGAADHFREPLPAVPMTRFLDL